MNICLECVAVVERNKVHLLKVHFWGTCTSTTQILYLSKSRNTIVYKYSITNKSPELRMVLK